jgi:hypothetical protein
VAFFAFEDERYFGAPGLAPGACVRFDPELLFAAIEREGGRPVIDRRVPGDAGLVVHEAATDVPRWPTGLWLVGDLERPVRVRGGRGLRCRAFTVLDEVPAWLVAGPRGYAVEWVIDRAQELTADQVATLAALPSDDEEPLTRALWDRWLQDRGGGSPIGCGLVTLLYAIKEAACRVERERSGWDLGEDAEVLADPAWQSAGRAAYGAALALGAPGLLPPGQDAVLAHRWTSVFGIPRRPAAGLGA